jgi:hypothetical protein
MPYYTPSTPANRTLASCTRQHADHSVPLLRRHHEALPHTLETWSASGTAHLRLPVLQRRRYKGAGGVRPLVAPAGHFSLGTDAIVRDSGMSDPIDLDALQHQVQHLPAEVVLFLLGSRYCETDRLSDEAWRLFGKTPLGSRRAATPRTCL